MKPEKKKGTAEWFESEVMKWTGEDGKSDLEQKKDKIESTESVSNVRRRRRTSEGSESESGNRRKASAGSESGTVRHRKASTGSEPEIRRHKKASAGSESSAESRRKTSDGSRSEIRRTGKVSENSASKRKRNNGSAVKPDEAKKNQNGSALKETAEGRRPAPPESDSQRRDRLRRERQKKAAEKRRRQLILRLVIAGAVLLAAIIGIVQFSRYQKQKALEPENGTGTTILQAAEENVEGSQSGGGTDSSDIEGSTENQTTDGDSDQTGSTETGSLDQMSMDTGSETAVNDPDNSVTLCMVGDVILHQCMLDTYEREDGSYNFDELFQNVSSEISKYDIKIVNQETILGGSDLEYSGYPAFNTPYEEADALANAGFNVVLQASNHTLDKGQEAVRNCLHYWNTAHPDMAVLGIHDESESSQDIYMYEKNGIRIAILNYTYGTNQYYEEVENGEYTDTVNFLDTEKVQQDVAAAREMADYVVVCPHWGEENEFEPSSQQILWTQCFLDWGVDLVIGTHPHVIQPVETYTRSDGHQMLVYNSVGNFCSNQEDRYGSVGAMAQVVIEKNEEGSVHTAAYGVRTLVTHETGDEEGFTTYFLDEYTEDMAAVNGVLSTDPDFSYTYCWNLRDEIFGDLGKIDIS